MLQTSVEIVNPGGTGRPAFVISASPDPLPPSRSFMFRLPSAFPAPKKYTCFRDLEFGVRDLPAGRFALAFFAIQRSGIKSYVVSRNHSSRRPLGLLLSKHARISKARNRVPEIHQQRQAGILQLRLRNHDANLIKEALDRRLD